jgi:hypothetical protein
MKTLLCASLAVALLAWPSAAAASSDGYAGAAYAIVVLGGMTTSAGMQVNLLRGEPDPGWARAGAVLGGINAAFGAGFLIASGIVDEQDDARLCAVLGGSHFAIAAANTLWGVLTITAADSSSPDAIEAAPAAMGFQYRGTF